MEDEGANTGTELEKPPMVDQTMSPTIGKLALALSKAQGMMSGAAKGATSQIGQSHKYKYATLADVWESIREPLSKNELAVSQITSPTAFDQVSVVTMLIHSSGEWLRGEIVLKNVATDPRGYGSALTYARRYGLSAIVGSISLDDDAETASAPKKSTTSGAPPAKSGGEPKPASEGNKAPNKAQLASLEKSMGEGFASFMDTNPSYETCRRKMIELAGGQKADPGPTKDAPPPGDDGAKQEEPATKKNEKKELF